MSRLYGPDEDELEDDDLDDDDLEDDDDEDLDDDDDEPEDLTGADGPVCSLCGCSEDNACEGGCIWARSKPWVCSRCAVKV